MSVPDYSVLAWAALALAAFVVGIAKTSVGGMAAFAVAVFATLVPVKESTAAVLLLLIIGDLVAVASYRRHADWAMLRRLLPAGLPGIALGALSMSLVGERILTVVITACLTLALGVHTVMRGGREPVRAEPHLAVTGGAGIAAGFTTMVANAAGPVMALYLLAARVDKARFVGTNAWFFLLVNVSKVPFSAGVGLFPRQTWVLTLALAPAALAAPAAPAVLAGTWLGRRLLRRLPQRRFEQITFGAPVLAVVMPVPVPVPAPWPEAI